MCSLVCIQVLDDLLHKNIAFFMPRGEREMVLSVRNKLVHIEALKMEHESWSSSNARVQDIDMSNLEHFGLYASLGNCRERNINVLSALVLIL